MRLLVLVVALAGSAAAQQLTTDRISTTTTPVPILRQVNRVNDDGSYTYGYEAADGSFKLETRQVNGEVSGKYGYVDSEGVQQVFEYQANKAAGFTPSSSLIPSPPPGLPLTSTSQVAPGTIVNGIDIALEGYSEDLDEDGFVDPIPPELLKASSARGRAPAAAPAPAPARPAAPAPGAFQLQAAAPQPQQQFIPQPQQQFAPQQQFVARAQPVAGGQRFFQPVQGFAAQGGVVNGFAPVPQRG